MVRGLWRRTTRVVVLAVALVVGANSVRAAENSLQLVPADAGFYSAMLRNKEQFDLLVKSKAFQSLVNLPQVQTGLKAFQAEYGKDRGELAQFRQLLESPLGKDITALLTDAASEEIFAYGSESWGGLLKLFLAVNNAVQFGPAKAFFEGRAGLDPAEVMAYYALKALADNLDLVKVPDLVFGFKIKDADRAEKLLKLFEDQVTQALKQAPPRYQGMFKRTTVGKSSLLTVNIQAALAPWDRLPIADLEQKAGEFGALVKHLKQLEVTLSLGVHEGFLILAVSPNTSTIAKLDGKGPLLKDTAEFKLLAKAGTNKLTDINYSSKGYLAPMYAANLESITATLDFLKAGLKTADLPEERKAKIVKDLEDLARDTKSTLPVVGSALSFNFVTARGTEGYAYDWTKYPGIDASRPLSLLNHVGGSPILFGIMRGKVDVESYKTFAKYVRLAYGHLDAIVQDKLPNEDVKKRYAEVMVWLVGLARKFDAITVDQFYPATADGQLGFVIDGKWTSKEWVTGAKLDKPMPMLEIALLMGLADGDLFVKSMTSYRKMINDAITDLGKLPEVNVPQFEIPAPPKKGQDLYLLPFEATGLDKQFQPLFGVNKGVALFACGEEHARRLLASKPLKIEGGPLGSRVDKPLYGAFYVDFPALVDALAPWVEFGVGEALKQGVKDEKQIADGMKALETVLKALKCVKTTSSATYLEDGALVTHSETIVKDLE